MAIKVQHHEEAKTKTGQIQRVAHPGKQHHQTSELNEHFQPNPDGPSNRRKSLRIPKPKPTKRTAPRTTTEPDSRVTGAQQQIYRLTVYNWGLQE